MRDITLTVPDDDYQFIKDAPVNASQLFREAVDEERDRRTD